MRMLDEKVILLRKKARFHKLCRECVGPEVKQMMYEMIFTHLTNAVGITRNVLLNDEHCKEIATKHEVFEWSMIDFHKRMDPNIQYVDVLRLEDPRTLGISKSITDLSNLQKFLDMARDGKVDLAITELEGCSELLHLRENLENKYQINTAKAKAWEDELANFDEIEQREWQIVVDRVNETVDRCMNEEWVTGPIQFRYRRNFLNTHFECLEHKLMLKENEIVNHNTKYHETITRDKSIYDKVMEFYKLEIAEYKDKIEYWTWKYDGDYEKADNTVSYKKLLIKTLKKEQADYVVRMEFYRTEVVRIKELIEQEKEAIRLKAIADEEAKLLQMERRKSKKGNKKDDKNKKKKK